MSDLPNPTVEPLKPCPFCGGKATFYDYQYKSPPPDLYWVACNECGVDTHDGSDSQEAAIAAWNRRTDEAERQRLYARIAELERANAELKAQLAERGEWEPVPDGLYERENDIPMRIMDGGRHIWTQYTIQGSILKENDHIFLEPDIRLCRRVQKEQAND
jgi:Lar family restriction alleviation protein